jgi:hypothetical protein
LPAIGRDVHDDGALARRQAIGAEGVETGE